jgi:predicted Rossmann fold flavoprotein
MEKSAAPTSGDRSYKAIIIGAGPAGLFAAIRLAQAVRCDIIVLEGSEKPARKLLASGSGQCNISHAGPIADFLSRYGGGEKAQSAARFLKPALYGFDNRALLDWFGARGVEFEIEENGKIFPADRRASSILKVLQGEARKTDIVIETKSRVRAVGHGPEGFTVHVEGREEPYRAPLLLLATGGITYPKTGSSGDGYAFAASLGHHILPPRPALAPVYIRDFSLEPLAGHSFREARLAVLRAGKRIAEKRGDLLITHQGFSGPVILDSSRNIMPGDFLEISFLPESIDEFRNRLDAELQAKPRRLVRLCLPELGLTKNMAELFCELARIPGESTAANLPRAGRDALSRLACAHSFQVAGLGSLDIAMVTAGGVDLAEVNSQTMESRLVPGLFFAGEILDFDGDTGGYNLQAAFSTGALAASSVGKRIS